MKMKDFIKEMNQIQVRFSDEDRLLYSDEFLCKYQNSYKIIPNGKTFKYEDVLLSLVSNNDCSNVEIGMITLNSEVMENENYFFIGKFEIDCICISKRDGRVVLVENENRNHVLYECSINSESFLQAIYTASYFLSTFTLNDDVSESTNVCYTARKCANQAGGNLYLAFYSMLLGCYE